MQSLIDAVHDRDSDAMRDVIDALIEEMSKKRFPMDSTRNLLLNVFFTFSEAMARDGCDLDHILKYSTIYGVLENKFTFDKLRVWLYEICEKIIECVKRQTDSQNNAKDIDKILRYIDENFTTDLLIKDISKLFYLNPAYLGQLFKKTVGISMSEYINRKRIAEVKRIYLTGEAPINYIIRHAGYNSQGYFYRKFRQYEGMSFADYCNSTGQVKRPLLFP